MRTSKFIMLFLLRNYKRIYYLCAQICRKHEKAEDYGAEQNYCRGVQGG